MKIFRLTKGYLIHLFGQKVASEKYQLKSMPDLAWAVAKLGNVPAKIATHASSKDLSAQLMEKPGRPVP